MHTQFLRRTCMIWVMARGVATVKPAQLCPFCLVSPSCLTLLTPSLWLPGSLPECTVCFHVLVLGIRYMQDRYPAGRNQMNSWYDDYMGTIQFGGGRRAMFKKVWSLRTQASCDWVSANYHEDLRTLPPSECTGLFIYNSGL